MKIITTTIAILIAFFFTSCEKVIDVDLETAAPRLVIEASIKWVKNTSGNDQKIKLTTTTGYYNTNTPVATGAIVTVTNASNTVFNFIEKPNSGEYLCSNFVPALNQNYILNIIYKGETYTANETLKPVPVIDKIEQTTSGFSNKDIEVKTYITDNTATQDFFLIQTKPSFIVIPTYRVFNDKYISGNQDSFSYLHEDLKTGTNLDISVLGVSERYYNYLNQLLNIAGASSGGGPFQTARGTIRGNIINKTNENNYALGYFSLSEVSTQNYLVK
jgi:hypothetical protein